MGYRSSVRCLIYGPPDRVKKFEVEQAMREGLNPLEEFKDDITYYQGRRYEKDEGGPFRFIDLSIDQVKWYDDYDDVTAWMRMVNRVRDAEDEDLAVEFIRVGEDQGDVEQIQSSDSWGFFYPCTTISGNEPIRELTDARQSTDSPKSDDPQSSVLCDPDPVNGDEGR